jgi:hypothetical protein
MDDSIDVIPLTEVVYHVDSSLSIPQHRLKENLFCHTGEGFLEIDFRPGDMASLLHDNYAISLF